MPNNYAEERAIPKVPACARSSMRLLFDGVYLYALGGHSISGRILPAVSGKPDANGKFDYSVARQKVPYQGPIPAGEYWVQPSQMWENSWLKNIIRTPRSAWGNFRLTIHPYPNTETYGRGGFFIHGGVSAGSAGCIDLTVHIDKFVDMLKKEFGGLPKCYMLLTVRYSPK